MSKDSFEGRKGDEGAFPGGKAVDGCDDPGALGSSSETLEDSSGRSPAGSPNRKERAVVTTSPPGFSTKGRQPEVPGASTRRDEAGGGDNTTPLVELRVEGEYQAKDEVVVGARFGDLIGMLLDSMNGREIDENEDTSGTKTELPNQLPLIESLPEENRAEHEDEEDLYRIPETPTDAEGDDDTGSQASVPEELGWSDEEPIPPAKDVVLELTDETPIKNEEDRDDVEQNKHDIQVDHPVKSEQLDDVPEEETHVKLEDAGEIRYNEGPDHEIKLAKIKMEHGVHETSGTVWNFLQAAVELTDAANGRKRSFSVIKEEEDQEESPDGSPWRPSEETTTDDDTFVLTSSALSDAESSEDGSLVDSTERFDSEDAEIDDPLHEADGVASTDSKVTKADIPLHNEQHGAVTTTDPSGAAATTAEGTDDKSKLTPELVSSQVNSMSPRLVKENLDDLVSMAHQMKQETETKIVPEGDQSSLASLVESLETFVKSPEPNHPLDRPCPPNHQHSDAATVESGEVKNEPSSDNLSTSGSNVISERQDGGTIAGKAPLSDAAVDPPGVEGRAKKSGVHRAVLFSSSPLGNSPDGDLETPRPNSDDGKDARNGFIMTVFPFLRHLSPTTIYFLFSFLAFATIGLTALFTILWLKRKAVIVSGVRRISASQRLRANFRRGSIIPLDI